MGDVQGDAVLPGDTHSERGAGTILMGALALLALLLVASAALLLQAASAASKAATAADLAALAAADAARGLSSGDPCAAASTVAEQHSAVIETCEIGEIGGTGAGTAVIRVSVGVPGVLPDAVGAARAGPPP
ncbi:Rv3654c family TadE-like protein [Arthrobacter sp. L77]|uniref:Rv3654c family TadE-like protein n=1 Tax=Arthrobacter sp. L77 TaxID=1496689 RepID=UPI00068C205A|nr:Rv3654c family TadE-like protein [Arthrobacter sp. L77]